MEGYDEDDYYDTADANDTADADADATGNGHRTIGDWTAYDAEGGEGGGSTWDPPPEFMYYRHRHRHREDEELRDGRPTDDISDHPSSADVAVVEDANDDDEYDAIADGEDVGNGWVAYRDDDGRTYYYHAGTGKTQWDRPGGTTKDDNDHDDASSSGEGGGGVTNEDGGRFAHPRKPRSTMADEERSSSHDRSSAAIDDDHDDNDQEDRDGAFDRLDRGRKNEHEDHEDEVEQRAREKAAAAAVEEKEKEKEKEEDTAVVAERLLRMPDALMEADVLDSIEVLVRRSGPEVAVPMAMQSLLDGYNGDAAMCGLLGSWLARLKSTTMADEGYSTGEGKGRATVARAASSSSSASYVGDDEDDHDDVDDDRTPLIREGAADAARDVVEGVIARLAKERFTKVHGDAIIGLDKRREAAFIDKMIKSDRWRRLLIDLSATNKGSMLFMICLQKISNLGHHRDIAKRIDPSEFFGVFDSMLQSELAIAGGAAVDGYAMDVVDMIDASVGPMGTLLSDLRRNCTSTSYTYLYAMEVIGALLTKSNDRLAAAADVESICHTRRSMMLKRAIRKWERLRDELEDEMLHPSNTGTTFQRKRRIDVALTVSDLFQRKRLRADPRSRNASADNLDMGISTTGDLENALDSALILLLTKNSLDVPIDKEVLDNVLKYAYGGSTDRIGDLLIRHPTAVTALLNNLFGPKRRIRQLETRLKCARLVALAVTASERAARSSPGDRVEVTESDESVLTEVILNGSQLCEQLENMVSFTVIDEVDENAEGSIGRQLSSMCIRHPVVSRGFMIWAKEHAGGPDFVATASYPTLSTCILCLVRLICRYHPLARPTALDISLLFLGHSNREISHQKMQSIKEQSLRLMLWLSTQGLSLVVISAVQGKLEKGGGSSSDMDSALVRYFLVGMIDISASFSSLVNLRTWENAKI
ncbi:hypothetical protein ACHAXA_000127 [Cyclostephanos tholiformis]|uniref:WW domain-containing protein n=1 Tax=Cyclostephanos tholiformis TaxID=382380 RepID=A0ABD3RXY1_9STRA